MYAHMYRELHTHACTHDAPDLTYVISHAGSWNCFSQNTQHADASRTAARDWLMIKGNIGLRALYYAARVDTMYISSVACFIPATQKTI